MGTLESRHADRVFDAVNEPYKAASADGVILNSWRRCLTKFGLDPEDRNRAREPIEQHLLEVRRGQMENLRRVARPELENLYTQIAGSGFCILLTDAEGVVIDFLSDQGSETDFRKASLYLGVNWSEESQGTNGIGTALAERVPVTVHLDDHFCTGHTQLTCSGAPIIDPFGDVAGVLDISSPSSEDSRNSQRHTIALVNITNRVIEYTLFHEQFQKHMMFRFHTRPDYVGQICEGLVALDWKGQVVACNNIALRLFGFTHRDEAIGRALCEMIDCNLADVAGSQTKSARLRQCSDSRGVLFHYQLRVPEFASVYSPPATDAGVAQASKEASTADSGKVTLGTIAQGDMAMAYVVNAAKKLVNCDIPLIITGETGSGKEVLAKAIHDASARADKEFVAINCASIPESLIESELFGYKGGAFTGARRDGMRGKIAQANGGTLFLDEIGDMPLHLQTRLLRVLEEHEVIPLGSDKAIPVKLNVIAATHRALSELIEEGTFRQDLYFRLNGITLKIPPLRERQDIEFLIHRTIELERLQASSAVRTISHDAIRALLDYSWPGNIREMRNVIRVAIAMCDGEEIALEHLPPDITSSCGQNTQPGPAVATAMADAMPHADAPPVVPRRSMPSLQDAERDTLQSMLGECKWNVTLAAQRLGISRATLYRKMNRHGLSKTGS